MLITGDDAAPAVEAKIHPRTVHGGRHGVEKLDFEILRHFDANHRRGGVFIDRLGGRMSGEVGSFFGVSAAPAGPASRQHPIREQRDCDRFMIRGGFKTIYAAKATSWKRLSSSARQ